MFLPYHGTKWRHRLEAMVPQIFTMIMPVPGLRARQGAVLLDEDQAKETLTARACDESQRWFFQAMARM